MRPKDHSRDVEWQYFNFFGTDGTTVAGAFTQSPDNCDLWLSVYGDEIAQVQKFYSLDHFNSPKDGACILDTSVFIRGQDTLLVKAKEGNIKVSLYGENPVKLNYPHLEKGIGDSRIGWFIPYLRMDAECDLTVNGVEKRVEGIAFHDNNWHDISPSLKLIKDFKYWMWGVAHTPSYSVLFVDIDYKPDPFKFFAISTPEKAISSNKSVKGTEFSFRPKGLPGDSLELLYRGERMKMTNLKHHSVVHGNLLERVVSRVRGNKKHYIGDFSFRDEVGSVYIESYKPF